MARKRGAKFLVVLIPAKNAVITKSHNFKSLKDRLREQHIDFLDPEEEFARFVQKKNTSAYWVYDGHMNLAGNELLGLLVAKYVLENRMVPLKDRDTLLEQTNQAVSNLI